MYGLSTPNNQAIWYACTCTLACNNDCYAISSEARRLTVCTAGGPTLLGVTVVREQSCSDNGILLALCNHIQSDWWSMGPPPPHSFHHRVGPTQNWVHKQQLLRAWLDEGISIAIHPTLNNVLGIPRTGTCTRIGIYAPNYLPFYPLIFITTILNFI